MKKYIALFVSLLLTTSLFADRWFIPVGFGFAVPIAQIKAKEDGAKITIDELAFDFALNSLFVNTKSGLTFKLGLDLGFGSPDDSEDGKGDRGFDLQATAGVGYSFIQTNRAIVAATLTLGAGTFSYDADHYDVSSNWLTFGADLSGLYRLNRSWGVNGSLGLYYILPVNDVTVDYGSSIDIAIKGNYRIVPRIGVVYTY